jgi:hypothetical protein
MFCPARSFRVINSVLNLPCFVDHVVAGSYALQAYSLSTAKSSVVEMARMERWDGMLGVEEGELGLRDMW